MTHCLACSVVCTLVSSSFFVSFLLSYQKTVSTDTPNPTTFTRPWRACLLLHVPPSAWGGEGREEEGRICRRIKERGEIRPHGFSQKKRRRRRRRRILLLLLFPSSTKGQKKELQGREKKILPSSSSFLFFSLSLTSFKEEEITRPKTNRRDKFAKFLS